jgi:hypothetical protein
VAAIVDVVAIVEGVGIEVEGCGVGLVRGSAGAIGVEGGEGVSDDSGVRGDEKGEVVGVMTTDGNAAGSNKA